MVYKKITPRTYHRKRNYRNKKRYNKKRYQTSNKAPRSILPNKYSTTLRYQENVSMNAIAGGYTVHRFTANGLYDPNITGIGHQYRGWDELIGLFDHAVVIGISINVKFSFLDATIVPMNCWVSVRDTSTAASIANDYYESSYTKRKQVTQRSNTANITYHLNPNKWLGINHPLSSSELKNSATTNPIEQCYFHIGYEAPDGLSDPPVCYLDVSLMARVVFMEPKQVAQS